MASTEERRLAMTTQFGRILRWVLSRMDVRLDLEWLSEISQTAEVSLIQQPFVFLDTIPLRL
jgi:hypothetical protein